MDIVFVLVEPQVPENIGASARALKTMGFSQLRLVNTVNHREPAAGWVAHGSNDILDNAQVFACLAEAVADCQLVVGTSAKLRNGFRELITPKELNAQFGVQQNQLERVAIVFGREDRGLSNDELSFCHQVTSIPLINSYPSLNLSQAVMLYAYELSTLQVEVRHQRPAKNEVQQYTNLQQRANELLAQNGFEEKTSLTLWANEKIAQADADSVRFLHALCASLEK